MVSALSFTTDGAYMLSGGEESVLVMTQLETQRHQFLPRLGGAISHISVSPNEIKLAVCLYSNKIRIIDSINNKIVKTIQGIGICHRLSPKIDKYHQHFSYNPRNPNCFVLPSVPGSIQFYDLQKDRARYTLQLVRYSLISRTDEKNPDRYIAEFMVFNAVGNRLITVLKRKTRSILGHDAAPKSVSETECSVDLVTLQIWHFCPNQNQFVLNTRIDSPHHDHSIRGIVFHPNKNVFLSFAHNDHHFKIWEECYLTKYLKPKLNAESGDINKVLTSFGQKQHVSWKSAMTGYYHKDSVNAGCFSNDGTILFIAAANVLTLWNASNLILLKTIDQSQCGIGIRCMQTFKSLPYLLTINEGNVNVNSNNGDVFDDVVIWDLVQFKQHWSLSKEFEKFYEVTLMKVFDSLIIPFGYKDKASHSMFIMVAMCKSKEFGDVNEKYLILCDMQNKEIMHQWILPNCGEIKENCLIIQAHKNSNKDKSKSIEEHDIDVVLMTHSAPIRIPCLFTQTKLKQSGNDDDDIKMNDLMQMDEDKNQNTDDAVTQYLEKLSGNDSIFQRIFGAKQLQSAPVNKEDLKKQKELTQKRLAKLTPSVYSKTNAVEDMFCGSAHTLPAMSDMFDQYMAYYVEPNDAMERDEEKKKKKKVGNTDIVLEELEKDKTKTINVNISKIGKSTNKIKNLLNGSTKNGDDNDEDDYEMDQNEFDNLRSIVSESIIMKPMPGTSLKMRKTLNGNISSFWTLRNGLGTNGRVNGKNGSHSLFNGWS